MHIEKEYLSRLKDPIAAMVNSKMKHIRKVRWAVPGTSSSTQNGGPVILELPLDKIRRPLMRTRANDQNKVKELMDSIKEIGLQVPHGCDSFRNPKTEFDMLLIRMACVPKKLCCLNVKFVVPSLTFDSRDAIAMKLISALGSPQFDAEQKKH
ncbi:hypothetical protein DKX38_018736 [Salix brachista]|uniref:Uncharacterized protein n=1 Tax=Salix brachista TaxID=2182728 RepID=A0A5N5KPM4_9ROSI|nr:hypothetical protein DKX38_018736 [Salix brachista]